MQRTFTEKISLAEAITRLESNDPKWDTLILNKIIINPTTRNDNNAYGDYTCSHITDESLEELAAALKINTTLKSVRIYGIGSTCSIEWTSRGARAMGQALKDHPNLENISISLQTYRIGDQEMVGFFDCLTGFASIQNLSIEVYCLNNNFIEKLGIALAKQSSLVNIYLSGGAAEEKEEFNEGALSSFTSGLANQKNLKKLIFRHLPLNPLGYQQLANALSGLNLSTLSLSKCGIDEQSISSIGNILQKNNNITKLELGYNSLNMKALQILQPSLFFLTSLKSLSLMKIRLTNEMLESLINGYLKRQSNLSKLSISSNRLTVDDMELIASLIDANSTLKQLDLRFCRIDNEHLIKIIPLLGNPEKCQIERFKLGPNILLSKKTQDELLQAIKNNEHIYQFSGCSGANEYDDKFENYLNINYIKSSKRYYASQQAFINIAIDCCKLFLTPYDKNTSTISLPPAEIVLLILLELGKHTLMPKKNVRECSDLILNNFITRKDLIKKGAYNPKHDTIYKWWSLSLPMQNKSKNIFRDISKPAFFQNELSKLEGKEKEDNLKILQKS